MTIKELLIRISSNMLYNGYFVIGIILGFIVFLVLLYNTISRKGFKKGLFGLLSLFCFIGLCYLVIPKFTDLCRNQRELADVVSYIDRVGTYKDITEYEGNSDIQGFFKAIDEDIVVDIAGNDKLDTSRGIVANVKGTNKIIQNFNVKLLNKSDIDKVLSSIVEDEYKGIKIERLKFSYNKQPVGIEDLPSFMDFYIKKSNIDMDKVSRDFNSKILQNGDYPELVFSVKHNVLYKVV